MRVIVEREFEAPVAFEDVERQEREASFCLELHDVRYVRTYFSHDRRRMLCEYEAPDAESVRLAQASAKMPFTRVWSAELIEPES